MSDPGAVAAREAAAARLLARHEVVGGSVRARGPQGEIAVLSAPPDDWDRLLDRAGAPLIAEIRALGFRYVALDLGRDAGND